MATPCANATEKHSIWSNCPASSDAYYAWVHPTCRLTTRPYDTITYRRFDVIYVMPMKWNTDGSHSKFNIRTAHVTSA